MAATAINAFIGSATAPTDPGLDEALGRARRVWDRLLDDLASDHGATGREWKHYSAKGGWSLRVTRAKRTIVWLAPCKGFVQVAFILGDKAVAAAREAGLPAETLRLLDEAPRYPEGTGVRLHVKTAKDLVVVRALAAIKVKH